MMLYETLYSFGRGLSILPEKCLLGWLIYITMLHLVKIAYLGQFSSDFTSLRLNV